MRLLVCLLASCLLAPALPAAEGRFPIEKLTIEGLHQLSAAKVRDVLGLRVGEMAGKPDFDAARERLTATGAFESVGYEFGPLGKGYAVTYSVVEIAQQYPFKVEDLPVTEQQVRAYLERHEPLFTGQIPGNQTVFDQYARRIQELLSKQGKPEKITAKLTADTANEIYLIFRPNRPGAAIAEVDFTGNEVIPKAALQQAIAGVAIGATYNENFLRGYLDNTVRPLYEARGRIRVSFPHIYLSNAKDVHGVVVHVTVNEGPSYSLGDVKIDSPVGDAERMLREGKFRTGDLADFSQINAGIDAIKENLRHEGYVRVTSKTDRKIDDTKRTVALTVHVDPGPQFLFGKLTVEGLDIQSEPEIRRLWGKREGKPFDPSFPQYFLQQVKERNVFEHLGETKSSYKLHNDTHTADVTLEFSTKKSADEIEREKHKRQEEQQPAAPSPFPL